MAKARETFTPFLVHIFREKVCAPWFRKSAFRFTTRLSPECFPQNKPLSPAKASQSYQLPLFRPLRAEMLGLEPPRIVNLASAKIASHYYQWPPFRKKFAPQTQIFSWICRLGDVSPRPLVPNLGEGFSAFCGNHLRPSRCLQNRGPRTAPTGFWRLCRHRCRFFHVPGIRHPRRGRSFSLTAPARDRAVQTFTP
jgi:hypothetical protein